MGTIEKKFPQIISAEELIKSGGKQIKNTTYYELKINEKTGIYEPLSKNDENKIIDYVLRSIRQ